MLTKKEEDCNLFNARLKGRLHDIPDNILVLIWIIMDGI